MTVYELITELRKVHNQQAPVTVRMWMAEQEITAVRIERDTVELIWRDLRNNHHVSKCH